MIIKLIINPILVFRDLQFRGSRKAETARGRTKAGSKEFDCQVVFRWRSRKQKLSGGLRSNGFHGWIEGKLHRR